MIRVRDLRVDYDTTCAVRDLSLDVAPGDVCGLIGPNGAGKTSTMRALLGLVEPTYGEIEVAGVDMRERPRDAARLVGFMPDFPPLYEDLLCWEFLDLFAASYDVPRRLRRERVDTVLDLVGLAAKREAPAAELSRGMRQRLMLAKTLLPDPKVLVLDEPASGVDPLGRIDLKNILKAQADAGKAVLISSHILAEMSEFCTTMAIMEKGRLIVAGSIETIRHEVMGGSTLSVEVLGDPALFLSLVRDDPRASDIQQRAGHYVFRYGGTPDAAADLLARLVAAGVRIASFQRHKEGLEELFLRIGAREVS
ncbi:MAG: ABC transporter [Isosphaeraceae bacterium]|jgi:ABC-2 type transport system ATP-binding protein|nr:MAG: ABC transporter [Isosphaeraceae bacterium]